MATTVDKPGADKSEQQRRRWASLILRDVQFWIPIAVLVGGLLALRWVS